MVQYVITGLAGLVLGLVIMRLWQSNEPAGLAVPGADPAVGGAVGDSVPASDVTGRPAEAALPVAKRLTPRHVLIGAGAITAAAVAVIALRADDASGPLPAMAASGGSAADKSLDDVDTMIGRLSERLQKNPQDGEGYRMLGWSYMMTGRPEKAIEPYKRALELLPNSALVHSGYAEALVGVAKDTVTSEAKAELDRALALDPADPRARYFAALWQAQHGEEKVALDKWIALANAGPADAPWQADVRRKITEVSGKLGVDVSARLKTAPSAGASGTGATPPPLDDKTVQAANALPAADRQAMVDQMVNGLAAKLAANPGDADRWVLLLRSRMVLKQADQARGDLLAARKALSGNVAGLAKVNAAAKDLGVPGA